MHGYALTHQENDLCVQTRPDTPQHRIERIRKPPVGSSSQPVGSGRIRTFPAKDA